LLTLNPVSYLLNLHLNTQTNSRQRPRRSSRPRHHQLRDDLVLVFRQ
jgi:hypothetical protein